MDKKVTKLLRNKLTEDTIKQEYEQTLSDRVKRYLEVKPHGVIPNTHFARASSECSKLYRDGHFYGCISLSQSVAEAIVKFLCKTNSWKPDNEFEVNIQKLLKRGFITPKLEKNLLKLWENRNDYHHLNNTVEGDYIKLRKLAKQKVVLLNKIEKEIFDFTIIKGVIVPKNSKYWTTGNQVYLRLD